MRILLIEPPFERFIGQRCEWYPIGLTSIATLLDKQDFTVQVYNAEHNNTLGFINIEVYMKNYENYNKSLHDSEHTIWQEIKDRIIQFMPDIVGISVKSIKVPSAIKIAEICKTVNKNTVVIAGGFHATTRPEDLLKSDNIDIVVRGEGENTFLELVESINEKTQNLKNIKGISFKNDDGSIHHTIDRELLNPLDSIPFPRRELILGYKKYTPEQLAWVMTSRGCPYDCSYCNSKAIWDRKVRFISLDNVLNEINYLKRIFGVKHINFMDDSFTVNRKRLLDICSMITENRLDITWSCLTRADLIDDEIVVKMKKAGCTKVDIGIESGSTRIQQLINKGINLNDVKMSSKILKKHGMFWGGFFMIGFPTETKNDIMETLKLMKEVKPNWAYVSIFTPYPGSKFYDMIKDEGLLRKDNDMMLYSHQSPDNCFSTNISRDDFEKITRYVFNEFNKHNNSLLALLNRAFSKKYYRNPKQLFKDIRKMLSLQRTTLKSN